MKQRNVLLLVQPAYPERIQGIARFAKSHGWHLTIVDRLVRFPRGWRGDGALVTLRGNEKTNRFVKGLVRGGVPVVDLTFNHPEISLPRVSGDHSAFGLRASRRQGDHAPADRGYFTNAFRDATGLTPKAWRKNR